MADHRRDFGLRADRQKDFTQKGERKMKLAIEQNTVSSKNQLLPSATAKHYDLPDAKLKIAIAGNSITCHGILPSIGWHNEWGMAASSEDKDFFHLVMNDFRKKYPDTSFLRIQASAWEREFWKEPEEYAPQIKELHDYDADIIVLRLSENCSAEECKNHDFAKGFMTLCDYLSRGGKSKLLITDSFWYSPWTAEGVEKAAQKYCGTVLKLSDLGERDEMKALGLFEHAGVAGHPGDVGMRAIADRILERLFEMV